MQSPKQKPLNWTRNGDKHNQAPFLSLVKNKIPYKVNVLSIWARI
jgi:hypothetical protein